VTRREVLDHARQVLTKNHINDASLEAELLLRHTLDINRVRLYSEQDVELTPQQSADFWQKIERRMKNEPSAYITGHREFYGLDFQVNTSVLIPRPETELLVEKAILCAKKYRLPVIVDTGTGSGAIAISLAVNLPDARIYATDISVSALEIAYKNTIQHGVSDRIRLLHGDLLQPVPQTVDIIVANLPYVTATDMLSVNTAGYEPQLALDGGHDGLDIIRKLCSQVPGKLKPNGCLLMEIGMGQKNAVVDFLRDLFPTAGIEIIPDLSGIDRVIILRLL
jgi:release factor glutamine methyltransferase